MNQVKEKPASPNRELLTPEKNPCRNDPSQFNLFEAIRKGDEQAFSAYYMGFSDSLVRFLYKILGDWEDAREVTQEVFVLLWENRARIDPQKALDSFIFSTAKNISYNLLRRRKTHAKYYNSRQFLADDLDISADELLISEETSILLHRVLAEMSPQRRKVFELSRFEGMTYEQIANTLNISHDTVKTHMKLALRDIRSSLATFLLLLLLG